MAPVILNHETIKEVATEAVFKAVTATTQTLFTDPEVRALMLIPKWKETLGKIVSESVVQGILAGFELRGDYTLSDE